MNKSNFFCKVNTDIKDKFDMAIIKNKKTDISRENVVEKLLKFYAKNGLPEKV